MLNESEYREFVDGLDCTRDKHISTRVTHAIAGICGESGEIIDVMKKHLFYETLTTHEYQQKLKDEAGDLFFYLTDLTSLLGMTFSELAERNMIKLRKRYPGGKFTKDAVLNKDKEAEQRAVDGKHHPGCPNNDIENVR